MIKAVMPTVHPFNSLHLTTPSSHTGNFLPEELQWILSPGERREGMSPTPSSVYKIKDTHIHTCSVQSVYLFFLDPAFILSSSDCNPIYSPSKCWRFTELLKDTGILRKQLQGVHKQRFLLHPPTFSTFSLTGDREQWG